VPWPQTAYEAMAAKGASVIRTVVFWDELEPKKGSIDLAYVTTKLDKHIARIHKAGMYTVINFYFGPTGKHMPRWAQDQTPASCMSNYIAHGQLATQYLAKRYGDRSDPLSAGQYTPIVAGFGVNEPTPDYSDKAGWMVHLLAQQATEVSWFREYAPEWIALLSCGFGASAPVPNATGSGQTHQWFTRAPADPLAAQGQNFMLDVHDYFIATTLTTRPGFDGRRLNGQTNWTSQGGDQIGVGHISYPAYPPVVGGVTVPRATCQAQHLAFLAPYAEYCAPAYANVPLCVGEWGWVPKNGRTLFSGGPDYISDKRAAWDGVGAVVEMQWDFGTNQATDPWAADPGRGAAGANSDGWQTVTDDFFALC
jgi:hypothetical protein